MSELRPGTPLHDGHNRPIPTSDLPPPGLEAIVLAALVIGVLLMGIQLWLLTVALDLFLGGKGSQVWQLALVSGAIFLGGLWMSRLLQRRPRLRRPPTTPPE